ncbi:MAG: hypothetical protein IBX44_07745 [Sulfurospirillum sp.]|nr:hypothetical protein [Sulfurospirillum sp.]
MSSKKFFSNVAKIPIIGDIIIGFAIIVTLIALASAGGYFGLDGQYKQLMINFFIALGIIYTLLALSYRIYKIIRTKRD